MNLMATRDYKTRSGYTVRLNRYGPWNRNDFAYLGIIKEIDCAWAWHADGRSIDRLDPAFDLIDFPKTRPATYFWLGAEGEA